MTVSVVVDDREPATVVATLGTHPDGRSVETRRLTAGDIAIGDVGFERKTCDDYPKTGYKHVGT